MNTIDNLVEAYRRRNYVILDTETTGLDNGSEIIEIAVLGRDGNVILNRRVKPMGRVPASATAIHGITLDMLKDAKLWIEIKPLVIDAIRGKDVIIYNAKYDRHMMHSTDEAAYLNKTDYHAIATFHCMMLWYADFRGNWNEYRQSNSWHKLTVACQQQGIEVKDAHGALGDCKMTLALLNKCMGTQKDLDDGERLAEIDTLFD